MPVLIRTTATAAASTAHQSSDMRTGPSSRSRYDASGWASWQIAAGLEARTTTVERRIRFASAGLQACRDGAKGRPTRTLRRALALIVVTLASVTLTLTSIPRNDGRRADEAAPERQRLAVVPGDGDPNQIAVADDAVGGIEIDPAGARQIHLHPRVRRAAADRGACGSTSGTKM